MNNTGSESKTAQQPALPTTGLLSGCFSFCGMPAMATGVCKTHQIPDFAHIISPEPIDAGGSLYRSVPGGGLEPANS
jgi:hypothetical protein